MTTAPSRRAQRRAIDIEIRIAAAGRPNPPAEQRSRGARLPRPPRTLRQQRTAELAIVLTDDAAIRALNRDWRGIDKPTNVLSFPAAATGGAARRCSAISRSPMRRSSGKRATKADFLHHLAHLAVHGFLHLLGYDHEIETQKPKRWKRIERKIMRRLQHARSLSSRADRGRLLTAMA